MYILLDIVIIWLLLLLLLLLIYWYYDDDDGGDDDDVRTWKIVFGVARSEIWIHGGLPIRGGRLEFGITVHSCLQLDGVRPVFLILSHEVTDGLLALLLIASAIQKPCGWDVPYKGIRRLHKHLILAQCGVRTARYGSSFFPSFYSPSAKRAGHENKEGKTGIHNLPYGPSKRGYEDVYYMVLLIIPGKERYYSVAF